MHRRAILLFAFLAWLLSCQFAFAQPEPPRMRLGDGIQPLAYDAALTIVPDRDGFDGRIAIDIDVRRAQDFFWINGSDIEIRHASLTHGQTEESAAVVAGNKDFIGLQFPAKIPVGKARLTIDYHGRFSLDDSRGLFKQKDGGNWYVLSQFEAMSARYAFPCFDEPQWKTPWTMTLTVRHDQVAVSNTPQVASEDIGGGMKRVRFATTPPLPSYLVALGVGPFDVVDGGVAGRNHTPLRYIVPKGRSAEAGYAVKVTPQLLALLEDYFGRPYPYPKLDSMVIPVTVGFSAMENAGLITYRANVLLSSAAREDENFRRRYAGIAAHEMAHQWFGDLVTMKWWNDVWLNESFATWMARKTVERFNPAWNADQAREEERQTAMRTDRLLTTHPVRQKIESPGDLSNSFDSITYDKGGAVLTMFEHWIGESAFRDGVRRYIDRHANGNATTEDFFAALSGTDAQLMRGFSGFVEQPGFPLVTATLNCSGTPSLHLAQHRFLPAQKAQREDLRWTIPVCVRYEGQAANEPVCRTMSEAQASFPLPGASSCPGWLLLDPSGTGYYLSSVAPQLAARVPLTSLRSGEAIAFIGDLDLMAQSGAFPFDQLLLMTQRYASDPRDEVVQQAGRIAEGVRLDWLDRDARSGFARWIGEHFGARAHQLGWLPRAGETDAEHELRATLLPLVADQGNDAALRNEARALALAWLDQPEKPALGAMLRPVLRSAAYSGDRALLDALAQAAAGSTDPGERDEIFQALGRFNDPAIAQQAYALVLDPRFDVRESLQILRTAARDPQQAIPLFDFIRTRYAALSARLPDFFVAKMAEWGGDLCSRPESQAFNTLFAAHLDAAPGAAHNLSQSLERIGLCIDSRTTQQPALNRFFTMR